MIIEDTIHLHYFLVEYRDANIPLDESTDEVKERILVEQYCFDSGGRHFVLRNDKWEQGGRPTCTEKNITT